MSRRVGCRFVAGTDLLGRPAETTRIATRDVSTEKPTAGSHSQIEETERTSRRSGGAPTGGRGDGSPADGVTQGGFLTMPMAWDVKACWRS